MARYVAFLRGVMPYNCKMAELKVAVEKAGFENVRTFLGSGNVLFDARKSSYASIEKKLEAAMTKHLGRCFEPFVRSVDEIKRLLAADPFAGVRIPAGAKKVVTFLHQPPKAKFKTPARYEGALIVAQTGTEFYTYYWQMPTGGPIFMRHIEEAAGKRQTTRSWQTVEKAAR